MAIERRTDREPEHRRHRPHRHGHWGSWGSSGDMDEFFGIDMDNMSPKAQAVTGLVVGGGLLLVAASLLLFTQMWWLIFVFGWMFFPAIGLFARGVAGLTDAHPKQLPENSRERELLEAIRSHGEVTPAQAAMETSLTVSEADEMLKKLAEGGHLDVRVRGGGLFYALWGYENLEDIEE